MVNLLMESLDSIILFAVLSVTFWIGQLSSKIGEKKPEEIAAKRKARAEAKLMRREAKKAKFAAGGCERIQPPQAK